MFKHHFSLDQFVVFITVVDEGGFAAAARRLNRAQSAITYAIKGLEEQCGLVLFDRSAYRPTLTDAGRALLPRVRRVLLDVEAVGQHAGSISAGLEANLTLVVNNFVPLPPAAKALAQLHQRYPLVRVRLVVAASFDDSLAMIQSGQAELGLIPQVNAFSSEMESVHWLECQLVAVAAPTHPLVQLPAPIELESLRGYMQLVWMAANATARSQDYGVHSLDAWHVTDLNAKRDLLLAGTGWGSMPIHMVADDIAAGRLVQLSLNGWEGRDRMPDFPAVVAWRKNALQGPAFRLLRDALREQGALFGIDEK
ncbi:LysR family transcriptional regulator [Curvibacter sp. CHRR-16]|uniref:LysR family transcriptional regulator n=1 Tax=Curvibacter sp. CHRR-16 TaxID=2835872 RepID=UPI001BDAE25B|nr:LysR family transcriptional regulator [Curvibacter sp. CHRR-16]MBT0569573.1 LysR family transcriptional regulator [Curvibacter sp. CHRR-16]